MQGILEVFGTIGLPIALASVVSGLFVGFLSRKIPIDNKTLYLLVLIIGPWVLPRILYLAIGAIFGFSTVSGTGVVGVILLLLYFLAFFVGRQFK